MPRMMWPAYMLAKRRTASVKMRRKAEKTSMSPNDKVDRERDARRSEALDVAPQTLGFEADGC